MTNNDLNQIRGVIKEEIDSALEPIKETLGDHTKILTDHTKTLDNHTKILTDHTEKLDNLWDQTVTLTEDMAEVKDDITNLNVKLDQIDRKFDNSLDKEIEQDQRLEMIESIPTIAHQLRKSK